MGARSGAGAIGSAGEVDLLNNGRRRRVNGMRSAHIVGSHGSSEGIKEVRTTRSQTWSWLPSSNDVVFAERKIIYGSMV